MFESLYDKYILLQVGKFWKPIYMTDKLWNHFKKLKAIYITSHAKVGLLKLTTLNLVIEWANVPLTPVTAFSEITI